MYEIKGLREVVYHLQFISFLHSTVCSLTLEMLPFIFQAGLVLVEIIKTVTFQCFIFGSPTPISFPLRCL